MKARRSSARVTLVLLGVAALAGCGRAGEERRDIYASREDCLADWANRPEDCRPASDPAHASHGWFYGPSYFYRSGGALRDTVRPHTIGHAEAHASRGGFGSFGRSSGG
jgi:uncharacterized protein YgiB involved in biofilm formation